MDESVTCTDEGKRSILKPRMRMPLQEVQSFFPDDDATVTCTLTKSRRVSFGRNLVKGFIIGSAADCEAVYEYEQSSESLSDPSECSGPLDLALNKSVAGPAQGQVGVQAPAAPAVTPHDTSSSMPQEERARLFTENCISIAKSVFHDTETELTAIIIGAKPSSMDSSCMNFTNLEMSHRFDHLGDPRIAQPAAHSEMAKTTDPFNPSDKSRYDFLNGSLGCPNFRVKRTSERTPLSSLEHASPWDDDENVENIPPAHCSFRQLQSATQVMPHENTMEFTCANTKRVFAMNTPASHKSDLNATSDMEETCAQPVVQPSHNSTLWDDTSEIDDIDDPLCLDGPRDNFLSDASGIENQSDSDCSFDGIQKELANLSTVNRSYRQQLETLNTTHSQSAVEEETSDAGSPLAVRLSPSVVGISQGSQPNCSVVEQPSCTSLMEITQSQDDEENPFAVDEGAQNIFASPDKSVGKEAGEVGAILSTQTQTNVPDNDEEMEMEFTHCNRLPAKMVKDNSPSPKSVAAEVTNEKTILNSCDEDMEFTHCKRLPAMLIEESIPIPKSVAEERTVQKTILNIGDEDMEFTHCVRPGNWKNYSEQEEPNGENNQSSDFANASTAEDPFEKIGKDDELFGSEMTTPEALGLKGEGKEVLLPVLPAPDDPACNTSVAEANLVEQVIEEKQTESKGDEVKDVDNSADMEFTQSACLAKKQDDLVGSEDVMDSSGAVMGTNSVDDVIAADPHESGLEMEMTNMSLNATTNYDPPPETEVAQASLAHIELPNSSDNAPSTLQLLPEKPLNATVNADSPPEIEAAEAAEASPPAHIDVCTAGTEELPNSSIHVPSTLQLLPETLGPLSALESVPTYQEPQGDKSINATSVVSSFQQNQNSQSLQPPTDEEEICQAAKKPMEAGPTEVESFVSQQELVPILTEDGVDDDVMDMTVPASEKTQCNDEQEGGEPVAEEKCEAGNVTEVTDGVSRLPLHTPLAGLAALATRPSLRDKLETVPSDSTAVSVSVEPSTPMEDNLRSMELSQATVTGLVKTMSDEQHMHAICESTRIIEFRQSIPSDRTFQINVNNDPQATFAVEKKSSEDTYCVSEQVTADSFSKRAHSDSPCPGERIKKTRPSFSPRGAVFSRSSLSKGESSSNGIADESIPTCGGEQKETSPVLEATKRRAMESPFAAQRLSKKNRPSYSPIAFKVVQDAEISCSEPSMAFENLDVSITLENVTLDEENSMCMRDEATYGKVQITPMRAKSFHAEKSYACQFVDNFQEDLNEYSITQPVVSVPPVDDDCDFPSADTTLTNAEPIQEPESSSGLNGTAAHEDADVYQRVANILQSHALEKECIWQLETMRDCSDGHQGLIIVNFPLISSKLVLEIHFEGQNLQITNLNTQHRQEDRFQWRLSREMNGFAFNALDKYIHNVGKKLQSLDQLPDCMDFINAFTHKLTCLMQDLNSVLRGCSSSKLRGDKLAIRLCSFPTLMSCWVELDLADILVLGRPGISFQHEMGRLDEEPIRNVLLHTQAPVLQNFTRSAVGLIESWESKTGLLTRRLPLLF